MYRGTCSIVKIGVLTLCVVLAGSAICQAQWLKAPAGKTAAATPGQWQTWSRQYQQARLALEQAEPGSDAANKATTQRDQALERGRQFAAKLGKADSKTLLQFIRDWQPASFVEPIIEQINPLAQRELDLIMVKADPYPLFPVRAFLQKWHDVKPAAYQKALASYDEQAKPHLDAAMKETDRTQRAKKLKIFIMQWKPSSHVAAAAQARQDIADDVFAEMRAIGDSMERRRKLATFLREFPDSRQVRQAQDDLSATQPVVVATTGGTHGRPRSYSQRAMVNQLEFQKLEQIGHQNVEKIDHQNNEQLDKHKREQLDRQNIETEKMQGRENEAGQNVEAEGKQGTETVVHQDVEQDRQAAEGDGRAAQQARQGVAAQAQTNASQNARQAKTNQAKTARQGTATQSQQARQGQARQHTIGQ